MSKKQIVVQETYLVGVERPCCPGGEDFITVTDDYEGFGPDLLATYPIEKIDAKEPEDAAWDYAVRHHLLPIRAIINLSDHSAEWKMDNDGLYEV